LSEVVHDTDIEWEKWGSRDPYFGVLTHDRFRSTALTAAAYNDFFESGRDYARTVLATCRRHFGIEFDPQRVLDLGCGVGRVLVPFAEISESVVGTDVSESMLAEARRNCARFGITNAELVRSDDALTEVEGTFDLVHSTIVLQHIESERGLDLIARLVERITPGGAAAIHVTYGRNYGKCRYGRPIPEPVRPPPTRYRRMRAMVRELLRTSSSTRSAVDVSPAASADPVMMMYHYDLSRIAYIFHAAGATGFHAEFTDHGGELGATLYARTSGHRAVPNT
jgi:SAM-dependent methyltransferase